MRPLLHTALFCLALAGPGRAQGEGMNASRSLVVKEEAAAQVDRIGAVVDPDLQFTDERGYPYTLRQLFPGKQPVVLLLGYYSCPAMCGQVMESAFAALSDVELQPGTDYRVLSVSINPRETPETALARKQTFLPKLTKTGGDEAWHLLVGDEASIKRLTETVGFRYYWSEHTNQYAHPPSLLFLTPQGKLSRAIVNTAFDAEDLRLALVEASEGKLGTFWDQVKLNCLTFDSRTSSYSLAAMTIMRVGGAITVVVIGAMILLMLRKDRGRTAPAVA
ncbi:MAG TPA: SCO family protein [Planctomycetota bacterium]|nr:SCO family protein [Planctomycetota bacterium]